MNLTEAKVLFVDCQSTGASPKHGEILEVGWADGDITQTFIHQVERLPSRITRITGITADMVETQGLPTDEIAAEFRRAVESADFLVAHYASFEKGFLEPYLEGLNVQWVCTHKLASRLLPDLPQKGIRAVAGFIGEPVDEAKRCSDHLAATQLIWRRFRDLLMQRGVHDLAGVAQFERSKTQKTGVRTYPLPREARLALPDVPGVYRFLAADKRVLYVGKASSLKSRVNSYYRGKKGKPSRTLELLSQVYAVDTVETPSALHAALLESAEIKRLEPPYNSQQRSHDREIAYVCADAFELSTDSETGLGPYSSMSWANTLGAIAEALAGSTDAFDTLPGSALSLGPAWAALRQMMGEPDCPMAFLEVGKVWQALRLDDPDASPSELLDVVELELGEEDTRVIDFVFFTVLGFWRSTQRSIWLRRVANAKVRWDAHKDGEPHELIFNEPEIGDLESFDRVSALLIELQRVARDGRRLEIEHQNTTWTNVELDIAFTEF